MTRESGDRRNFWPNMVRGPGHTSAWLSARPIGKILNRLIDNLHSLLRHPDVDQGQDGWPLVYLQLAGVFCVEQGATDGTISTRYAVQWGGGGFSEFYV